MRIISGRLKGKSIKFIKNSTTRPLKDSVKENIFNILEHSKEVNVKITKANILDLYSGIGSFGIECISRGANRVTFVEQDRNIANILKDNLIQLSILDKTEIITNKIENVLKKEQLKKYNIFFFDPPFADKEFLKNIDLIKKNKIYENDHVVIIHRERKTQDKLDNFIDTIFFREYGRSKILFGVFN